MKDTHYYEIEKMDEELHNFFVKCFNFQKNNIKEDFFIQVEYLKKEYKDNTLFTKKDIYNILKLFFNKNLTELPDKINI